MEPRRFRWKLLGSCLVAVVAIALVAVAGFLVVGERMARDVRAQMSDPEERMALALQILGAERLPVGLRPTLALGIPLLGHVVVLEGEEQWIAPGETGPTRVFVYLEGGDDDADLDESVARMLDVRGLSLERDSVLARDADSALAFTSGRGRLRQRPRGEWPVLVAVIEARCPDETRPIDRFAIWIERDPAPSWESGVLDFTGTPVDPDAVRGLLSVFDFCRARLAGS